MKVQGLPEGIFSPEYQSFSKQQEVLMVSNQPLSRREEAGTEFSPPGATRFSVLRKTISFQEQLRFGCHTLQRARLDHSFSGACPHAALTTQGSNACSPDEDFHSPCITVQSSCQETLGQDVHRSTLEHEKSEKLKGKGPIRKLMTSLLC